MFKKEKLKKLKREDENQISLFEFKDDELRGEIDELEINNLTHLEALNKLHDLKKKVKEKS